MKVVSSNSARCRKEFPTVVCENPLCGNSYEQTGLVMNPRRYCSDECKQQGSILKRAARLLVGLDQARVWEILKGLNG